MKKPHHLSKPVYQYTVAGFFVKEYESSREAAKALGVSRETIGLVLRKVNKTAKNFQFSFEKKDRIEPLQYTRNRMLNHAELEEKRSKNVFYRDLGIVNNPESRDHGKRKIRIADKMDVYLRPGQDINEIVQKYSMAI